MKALVRERYGSPDLIELREVEPPAVTEDGVLVRVRAASVNPADWHALTGTPFVARFAFGLRRPKRTSLGTDFAGTVEAVGAQVTRFRPGDDVFGGGSGALAEYVCLPEDRAIVPKPANVSFEQAASVAIAGVTALQGLREKGRLETGQAVLVNGASGGVGTFAVQIAKALGAQVTAVCSTLNVDVVRSLGADRVLDYTREDFTREEARYDLILDVAGNRNWREYRRVLRPKGVLVVVGGPKRNRLIGPLGHLLGMRLASIGDSRKVVSFIARIDGQSLIALSGWLESGAVTPVIDRRYELGDVAEAFRYLAAGRARGKVVVTVS